MEKLSDVAIIILNYNAGEMTLSCVKKLLEKGKEFHIVVVDNFSTDSSAKLLVEELSGFQKVTVLCNDINSGYAAGNNVGLRFVKNHLPEVKYALIMNPDMELKNPDTLAFMKEALESEREFSVASVKMLYNGKWRGYSDCCWKFPERKELFWSGTFAQRFILKNVNNLYEENEISKTPAVVDVLTGCFFMVKLEDLYSVGFLDEGTFLYFEETILAKKLEIAGKKEILLTSQEALHNHQEKDTVLKNHRKRLVDRKFFHDSKVYYIKNYSDLRGVELYCCLFVNGLDFLLKKIVYGTF